MTILSPASIVSSAVAPRLRPTASMRLPLNRSSPFLKSPMPGSSVTSQPHRISTRFIWTFSFLPWNSRREKRKVSLYNSAAMERNVTVHWGVHLTVGRLPLPKLQIHRTREVNHATEYLSSRLRQTARGRCGTPRAATGGNDPAGAQSLRNDLKDLKGELSFDDAVLQSAADDFGHVVHKKPVAVLRPGDAQDIAKLVQFANREGLKVAMRGQGHSFFGQTQVEGGVVIDSSSLNAVRIVKSGAGGTAEIGPGSKWHPVLMAANAQKLTVPVIADTFLSVGGTISTGGFGVTTYNLGLQVDHVQELEVVTGDGQIATCSDERNSDLFNAMLGGLGQCGIITKVVMRLMAAPTNVLFIKMDYDDFQSASADLALLAKDGRFHHLDGRGAGRPGRRRRVLRRRRRLL